MSDEPERRRDDGMPLVVHRLTEIERRLDAQAKEQARGFADVARQIAALEFVRVDVYAADQRTADQVHAELRKDINEHKEEVGEALKNLDVRINWSHAVIGVALLGGVVTAIARLAGVG